LFCFVLFWFVLFCFVLFCFVLFVSYKLHFTSVYTCQFCCALRCDFLLLMDVIEWMSYESSHESTCTHNIHNSSTRSQASEGESRTRNRSTNCKCERDFSKFNYHHSTIIIWSCLSEWKIWLYKIMRN
jgi:hypothetical protein